MTTFAELQARKKPVRSSVRIALESGPMEEVGRLQQKAEMARLRLESQPNNPALKKALEVVNEELKEAEAVARENSVEFVFEAIGHDPYEVLISDHQPTAAQKKQAEKDGDNPPLWNNDSFPQALVAASLVDPQLSLEEVEALWKDPNWNQAELLSLFYAAQEVNQSRRVAELGKD